MLVSYGTHRLSTSTTDFAEPTDRAVEGSEAGFYPARHASSSRTVLNFACSWKLWEVIYIFECLVTWLLTC